MKCGDAFLLYDEDNPVGKPHLHVLITDPDQAGQCVLVSITTRRRHSDTMVCLDRGDHEFITGPSVITYAYSKIMNVSKLEELVVRGDAISKEPASASLVMRAQQGMLETDRAPREVQQLFIDLHNA